jgi:hypothetical protein
LCTARAEWFSGIKNKDVVQPNNPLMTNSYLDLVKQTFNFPQEGLEVDEGNLYFNGLDLKALIAK